MKKATSSYAWVIVAACFLLTFAGIGIVVNCSSIFLKPVSEAMGFSRTGFSLCFTLVTLALIVGSLMIGKLMSKFSLRAVMSISGLLAAVGYISYSFCTTLPMFYAASAVIGLGVSGITVIPCSVMLTNWFVQKRGLATGIAFTGSGFGGMIFAQVANWLIQTYSWQQAYLILGICIAVIVLPVTLFLVCLHPAKKGAVAYGASDVPGGAAPEALGVSAGVYLKSKSFLLLGVAVFIVGIINLGVQGHIPAHLTDNGLTPAFAASMVTLYMVVLVFGKLILGAVFDKAGPVVGTAYASVVYVAAIAALLLAKAPPIAIGFAVLFGLCNAMATVSNPFITSHIVGTRNYTTIYSMINLFFNVGMAIGAPLSAAIYDAQGKYNTAFILYAVLSLVAIVAVALAVKLGAGYSTMKAEPAGTV